MFDNICHYGGIHRFGQIVCNGMMEFDWSVLIGQFDLVDLVEGYFSDPDDWNCVFLDPSDLYNCVRNSEIAENAAGKCLKWLTNGIIQYNAL